jgi:hypothetical protein
MKSALIALDPPSNGQKKKPAGEITFGPVKMNQR